MAGIQDVARLAGVGTGTVSRVINGSGYVSSKTRDRVERAVAELSYTPNELARNLLQNRSRIIDRISPTPSSQSSPARWSKGLWCRAIRR